MSENVATIKIHELKQLLTEKVESCQKGETKFSNIMLIAETHVEKKMHSFLSSWAKETNLNFCWGLTPGVLKTPENERQIVVPDTDLEFYKDKEVIFGERFNWSSDLICSGIESIVRNRECANFGGIVYDLSNVKILIVTAFPDNDNYRNVPVSKSYLDCFDKYEVVEEYSTKRTDIIGDFWEDGKKFNKDLDGIEDAIKRALNDLTARTLEKDENVSTYPKSIDDKFNKLKNVGFVQKFKDYFANSIIFNENDFDKWHEEACNLVTKALGCYYKNWEYGKSQKIVNMTFKYIYCLSWNNVNRDLFEYCHMPLDSYTLEWIYRVVFKTVTDNLTGKAPKKDLIPSWSSIKKGYRTKASEKYCYIEFVKWVREYFNSKSCVFFGLCPLEAEFYIWKEIQRHMALESLCSQLVNKQVIPKNFKEVSRANLKNKCTIVRDLLDKLISQL